MLRDSLQSIKSVAAAASSCGCWGSRVVCCYGGGGKGGEGLLKSSLSLVSSFLCS